MTIEQKKELVRRSRQIVIYYRSSEKSATASEVWTRTRTLKSVERRLAKHRRLGRTAWAEIDGVLI